MFSYDNKLFDAVNKIVDWLFAAVLWLVFSIPVFTIGASTTAFFETVHKVIRRGKGYVWRTFWTTFKSNFKKATLIWLIQLGILLLLWVDMKIMENFLDQGAKFGSFYYFFYVTMYIVYVWIIYTCVYIARIEDSIKVTMKNAAFLAIMSLPWTIVIVALFIGAIVLISVLPICVLILPTGVFALYDIILMRIFGKYVNMDDEDKVEHSEESIVEVMEE